MNPGYRNALRLRAVAVSQSFKAVFRPGGPVRIAARGLVVLVLALIRVRWAREGVRRWAYRTVFTTDGATLKLTANHVLVDLREFCFATKTGFSNDALTMARREGRREVFLRITNYLNLDEATVQNLMEIDDGI